MHTGGKKQHGLKQEAGSSVWGFDPHLYSPSQGSLSHATDLLEGPRLQSEEAWGPLRWPFYFEGPHFSEPCTQALGPGTLSPFEVLFPFCEATGSRVRMF